MILLPSVKSNDFRADFLAAIHSAHRFRAIGRIGGSAGELGCLGKLLSCRVIDNDSRVPQVRAQNPGANLGHLARLIGDKAYDSDRLDRELAERYGIEMIAPHRGERRRRRKMVALWVATADVGESNDFSPGCIIFGGS